MPVRVCFLSKNWLPPQTRPKVKPWTSLAKPTQEADRADEGTTGRKSVGEEGRVRQLAATETRREALVAARPLLLLHLCCAPCSTHVIQVLREQFRVAGHFYNPNIHPEAEYWRRGTEMEAYARSIGLPLLVSAYETSRWREAVRGLEGEPEGGLRCLACYRLRLEETAALALRQDFTHFTTTLSISPHKKADAINAIGLEVASQFGLEFYAADFKKKDGFTKSLRLSREAGLYRQDYCGCEFSLRF